MKKIFLYAYDCKNLGDDLFVRMLSKRYPKCTFLMWNNEKKSGFESWQNVKQIRKNSVLVRILQRIRPAFAAKYNELIIQKCDACVFIGGSIFIQYDTWRDIVNWWNYQAEKTNFFALGANFGPFDSDGYKESMGKVFAKMQDVCFRDTYSYHLFSSISNVRYAPDILFGYSLPVIEKDPDKVFISVINCFEKKEGSNLLSECGQHYEKFILSRVIECIIQGKHVILSSFCKSEGDEVIIESIYRQAKAQLGEKMERLNVLNYDGTNAEALLLELVSSELVVGTRFHAIILGLAAGCKVLPIVYSNKTKRVLQDLFPAGQEFIDIHMLEESVDINDSFIWLDESVRTQIISRSQGHFEKLDKFILGDKNAYESA